MYVFRPLWCGVVLYGVGGNGCYHVHFCVGDSEGVFFMIDNDDGCGVVVGLGCHAGPVD